MARSSKRGGGTTAAALLPLACLLLVAVAPEQAAAAPSRQQAGPIGVAHANPTAAPSELHERATLAAGADAAARAAVSLEQPLEALMKPRHHGHNGTHDEHKPLWPMDSSDALAVVLAAIVAFVAAGAGIGGGGILLPIFVLICKFEVRHAVALSECWVAAGSAHGQRGRSR
eukprot:366329-Chlamydomonas_euryale.AAC.7